ncbi:plastocyanin/azurin family copper-binding protein [Catenovulum sp. SX2]|uniref:plastocyanin/azurin family copper-binding protein n=1 Tax=Catenovulum sp. SX2 TaxID=3398614 RepID=UPI003F825788
MKKFILFFITLFSFNVAAAEHEVGQKNKEFTVEKITIKKGDTVKFVNLDPFFHNVFSLSDAKLFDLGSFPQNDSRDVVFEEAGTVDVECAIHPNMQMVIEVQE